MAAESVSHFSVYFNIVTGELLVDRVPQSRLPSEYEQYDTYTMLFGHIASEVMLSTGPSIHFAASKLFHGAEYTFFYRYLQTTL
jgi:hypothetical protein